jgi:hypothetical protein
MSPISPDSPCYRIILALDAERSTARKNPTKKHLREAMYRLLEEALQAGGIIEERRDPLIDLGDGVLVLVHPADQIPKTRLLNPVIPLLGELLAEHNVNYPAHELRLRAVVHAGEVHYDHRGCFGEALDIAFRLLNAPEAKSALHESATPLVLVTSDDIYRSIVSQGYDGIDDRAFVPLSVRTADHEHKGWAQRTQGLTVVSPRLAG